MRGIFVTGTDTAVGKTVVAASICAALTERGKRVAAFKPVVTGVDEQPTREGPPAAGGPPARDAPLTDHGPSAELPQASRWPPDHELLASAAGGWRSAAEVAPYVFGPPLSPHYAAALAGTRVEPERLIAAAHTAGASADALICEGVGGLLVPLADDYSVLDLARALALPLIVVARTGLGTINHTLLTVATARAAGLHVAAVVMTPWADPEPIEESNRATVERLTGVTVCGLPPATPATLAEAGAALPLDDWL
ncbi:MAG TPA: dethiobiotin synthase [Thermoleophilaceae bacterium]|nr:dethiobiotin synthase [Thermoleophilaceae bacterium]